MATLTSHFPAEIPRGAQKWSDPSLRPVITSFLLMMDCNKLRTGEHPLLLPWCRLWTTWLSCNPSPGSPQGTQGRWDPREKLQFLSPLQDQLQLQKREPRACSGHSKDHPTVGC